MISMPSKAELIVKSNFHQRKTICDYGRLDADRDGHLTPTTVIHRGN
jgi:hypothetical protein